MGAHERTVGKVHERRQADEQLPSGGTRAPRHQLSRFVAPPLLGFMGEGIEVEELLPPGAVHRPGAALEAVVVWKGLVEEL